MRPNMLRRCAAALTVALIAWSGQSVSAPAQAAPARAQLRVDQAGYALRESNRAILMTSGPSAGVAFRIIRRGRVISAGHVSSTDRGRWNATYRHTYAVPLTSLRTSGRYRLVVDSHPRVTATIRIRALRSIYGQVLSDGVRFDENQRDGGAGLARPLHPPPSHP